ncbi:MAG: alanine:cation symporter family protein [Clostridia bacterium]|nr:alanine:cation symporter family protein [Clostridia bacterium]
MEHINTFLEGFANILSGYVLVALVLAVGILLTIKLKWIQIFRLPKALKYMVKNEDGGQGDVSSFGALCTALSATIGTGNIVGVATAVSQGGPGALFWMTVASFFGLATKYTEGMLAVKYRVFSKSGAQGGPFFYIENGMGKKWKWLAVLFAVFGVTAGLFGIGTITQISGITTAAGDFFDPDKAHIAFSLAGRPYSCAVVISGALVTVSAAVVLIGGVKRIAKFSEFVVPFMAGIYLTACTVIICSRIVELPSAVMMIVKAAFDPKAVTGGAVGSVMIAVQKGIARGIFSNESGLGSAPIAIASAKSKDHVRQGLVAMTGTYDTMIICALTGLAIVMTGTWNKGLEGVEITAQAFRIGLPFIPAISALLLMISLSFFAFTSILGWNYYSERCLQYLIGEKPTALKIYKWAYILIVFIGPYLTVSFVWKIADICSALMALPNLVGLLALSGFAAKETSEYFKKDKIQDAENAPRKVVRY